jgi:tetratricopeptide (TPR) repeat protein
MLRALGLAALYRADRNKWEEAESLGQEGLAIARQTPDIEFPEMCHVYQALTYVRAVAADVAGAESFARKRVALCERVCGPRHPDTGFARMDLGSELRGTARNFGETMAEERKALAIFRHAYPAGHWAIGEPIGIIGEILEDAGDSSALAAMFPATRDLEEVESLYRQVLAESTAGGKEGNRPAVSSARNLAGLTTVYLKFGREMAAAGRTRESEAAGQKASRLLDELSSGDLDNADLRAANDLGRIEVLLVLGRREEAKRRAHELLALNPKDYMVLNRAARRVVTMDRTLRDPEVGVELAARAVKLRPDYGWNWNTLGVCHYYAGDFPRAVADLEKSMQLDSGGIGSDYLFMAMARHRLGDTPAARQWHQKALRWAEANAARSEWLRPFFAEADEVLNGPADAAATRPATSPARLPPPDVTTRPTTTPAANVQTLRS